MCIYMYVRMFVLNRITCILVQGYVVPLESRVGSLQLSKADIESLFGNVKEIKDFNR